jgi:hypothetical protein
MLGEGLAFCSFVASGAGSPPGSRGMGGQAERLPHLTAPTSWWVGASRRTLSWPVILPRSEAVPSEHPAR